MKGCVIWTGGRLLPQLREREGEGETAGVQCRPVDEKNGDNLMNIVERKGVEKMREEVSVRVIPALIRRRLGRTTRTLTNKKNVIPK